MLLLLTWTCCGVFLFTRSGPEKKRGHFASSISTLSVCPALPLCSVPLCSGGEHSPHVLLESKKGKYITILTCLHLWHQQEILVATSQDNCVCSQRQAGAEEEEAGGGGGCFWPPRQRCKPAPLSRNGLRACLAALGIRRRPLLPRRKPVHYVRAALLCKLSFSSFFSPPRLLSEITRESSRAEPLWWCNISQMSRDASQTHLPREGKYWLIVAGLDGSKWIENVLFCVFFLFFFFINENDFSGDTSWHNGLPPRINWNSRMKCRGDQWWQATSSL